jgi:hypothetical protein
LQLSAIIVGKRFKLGHYLFRESVVEEENRIGSFKIRDREVGVISIFSRVGRVFAWGSWSIGWSKEQK